ncbi:RHS repeat-associated protein [Chryseobacterium sp. H1D6B]|uniref:RHS repeat-associated core domain-containing protein n=1 Tax=Chryseobacterium sp. H1D6B TaxID=2940588 RepID=UPI0015CC195A|nr:RHS repeat-associated core domain-containing protein [Chryseobacterium sp. H1D6B]MDH6254189.1 RHS repeat-associated protein [Chryseobacterium sp. H1D6B]
MKFYTQKIKVFFSILLAGIPFSGFSQTAPQQKFHDTKGNIEVTGAGQLQYTLAVDLPPGVKAAAPSVSLIYTSGGQNGLAGYGWNLSGVTSISRSGRNLEKDGISKGVQLDYSDYYSFNGQRLILKSGEYGKDGAEYVTEKYSNIKIKSIGAVTGHPWQGPEYWEVTYEDGSQAWYGAAAAGSSPARTPIDYNIVKSKDISGNYITYNYILDGNLSVISSIQWGGNEAQNTQHFNIVEFVFGARPMSETAYIKGTGFSQTKLLESISVSTNNKQFKKYNLTYKKDLQETAYRYLDKIIVLNSKNEEANPVIFTYEKSMDLPNPNINTWSARSVVNHDLVKDLFGDFDGDGRLDLIKYHPSTGTNIPQTGLYIYKNFYNDAAPNTPPMYLGNSISENEIKEAVAVNLKKNNLIHNRQGFVTKKLVANLSSSTSDLELSFYGITENNQVVLDYKKVIPNADYDNSTGNPLEGTRTTVTGLKNVDFNGDGLSELILQLNDKTCTGGGTVDPAKLPVKCKDLKRYYAVDPDESIQGSQWYYPLELYPDYDQTDKDVLTIYKPGDFNGDGLFDFLKIDQYKYGLLVTFSKNSLGQYESSIIPFNSSNGAFKGIVEDGVVGDYNGDGLSDIMIPDSNDSELWYLYTSTGNTFKEETRNFKRQKKTRTISQDANQNIAVGNPRTFVAFDINNDGKTELISLQSSRYYQKEYVQDNPNLGVKYRATSGCSVDVLSTFGGGGDLLYSDLTFGSVVYLNSGNIDAVLAPWISDKIGLPADHLAGAMLKRAALMSIVTNSEGYLSMLYHKYYDISMEGRIKSISQGGITTDVTYKQLDKIINPGLYDNSAVQNYPYVEINQASGMYVVSQLTQSTASDKLLKQDFRYRGLTSNILGRGMIGFRKTVRSSWYADGYENTKIWSGLETDPLNDGIPVKEWSVRTNNEADIFPADVSENNTQLLSFKSTAYQIDKILNGQIVTTITDADKPKVVTAVIPVSSRGKDFLTNTTAESKITYGAYYLPAANVSKINNNYAVTVSAYEYSHNPSGTGPDYFIGRLKSKAETGQAYNDSRSAKSEYTYDNNMVKTIKTWNRDNSGYLLETYSYDGFGNMIQKVTGSSIDAQSETTMTGYDNKGRFAVNKTDNLGLISSFAYNDFGQILTQTDPLQNVITNTYDDWGKLLSFHSNLSGTASYLYERDSSSNIIITQNDPDGNVSKKYTNKLGQQYKAVTKAFGQGVFVSKEIQYDILGRQIKESEAYFEGQSAGQWNTISYDDTVYPAKVTAVEFTGKQMETSVSGLTTTVKELNGYGRTTSKTNDALGNVISSTDKGGTVQFSYNAAGEQIKAQYAENIVATKYDSWGRKSEFNDPSNGVYKYEYNGFGQPKKIISPKGTKDYIYNNSGQLITQNEISTADGGQATNKTISFTYDNIGRIITKSGTSKGQAYSTNVAYDPHGRISSLSESSSGKSYIQNEIEYDDFGRIISYTKKLSSSGVMTGVNIINVYSPWNGELVQIKDKSGILLWELKEANAKGQVQKTRLGAADVINIFDAAGFLRNISHSSAAEPGILNIDYQFNAVKNELETRNTLGGFNILEKFVYDGNNRLIRWTNPVTGEVSENIYDIKGRITFNNQVGTMKYGNTAKIYQPTGMTLNAAGEQNYTNNLIQSIIYNENNDPVFIDGEKGDAAFQYGLTNMRQRVTYGGNFSSDGEGKFTKFYSEDGSFEVVKNNITNEEKHVLFIGGTPYESNIVYLKNFEESSGSYKFLHKDYSGSILAVTDEAGNKLEQRHFDAWGNLTHLQIGSKAVMTGAGITDYLSEEILLVDRGYTSHEHFMETGIIHMNGRLYDPLLRRFLNADENIQDPSNTQNYNKYGYVMNNPLMYNDPNGEFLMWLAGAFAGGYLNGVQANGSWNPGKWNWEKTWGAVLGGAIGGAAISGALGNIANNGGAIKSFLPGLVSGGLSSAFNGSNFLGGAIGGISYNGNLFDNKITSTDMTGYGYSISEMVINDSNTLNEATEAEFSMKTVKRLDDLRYKNQFIRGAYHIVDGTNDLSQHLRDSGYSYGSSKNLLMNGSGAEIWGLTEMVTNKGRVVWQRIYLPKGAFVSLEQLDLTMGHEIFHSILNNAGLFDEIGGILNRRDSVHENFTGKWEDNYIKFRGWQKLGLSQASQINSVEADNSLKSLIEKIIPIYNNYLKSTLK